MENTNANRIRLSPFAALYTTHCWLPKNILLQNTSNWIQRKAIEYNHLSWPFAKHRSRELQFKSQVLSCFLLAQTKIHKAEIKEKYRILEEKKTATLPACPLYLSFSFSVSLSLSLSYFFSVCLFSLSLTVCLPISFPSVYLPLFTQFKMWFYNCLEIFGWSEILGMANPSNI